MSNELRDLPQFNLLYRLRERWAVSAEFVAEIERRLNEGKHAAVMRDMYRDRVAYLEQHVPPEIADPKPVVARGPRWTGD